MPGNESDAAVVDRRVRRTRQLLRDAFVSLILERGYDGTTVSDIVERADVGRSTFYAHFVDKEALLLWTFQELHFTGDASSGAGPAPLFALSREMFRHADEQRRLFRAVFGRFGGVLPGGRMDREVLEFVRGGFAAIAPAADERDRTMAARVAVSAFIGLLHWWLETDQPLSPDEVNGAFTALVLPGVATVLGVAPAQLTGTAESASGRLSASGRGRALG